MLRVQFRSLTSFYCHLLCKSYIVLSNDFLQPPHFQLITRHWVAPYGIIWTYHVFRTDNIECFQSGIFTSIIINQPSCLFLYLPIYCLSSSITMYLYMSASKACSSHPYGFIADPCLTPRPLSDLLTSFPMIPVTSYYFSLVIIFPCRLALYLL